MLTRQEPLENSLKTQLAVDEPGKVSLDVRKLVEEKVVAMFTPKAFSEEQPKLKVAHVVKKACTKRSRLARVTQKLYDLESFNEPEKPLKIELSLYQMEEY